MTDNIYDAVIVGAGIAGSIVAKQLVQEGKRVLILEAGPGTGMEKGGYRKFVEKFYSEHVKIPNSPFQHSKAAPAPSVLDIFEIPGNEPYLIQKGPDKYASNYTRNVGGTVLHWLGTCLRMLPNDFKLKTLYGHGEDWPISYEDLEPYYEKAEWEIGVAGCSEEQDFLNPKKMFRSEYDYPMQPIPKSYLDKELGKYVDGKIVNLDSKAHELRIINTPAGRNSNPNLAVDPRFPERGKQLYRPIGDPDEPDEMGERCQGNSSCVPICPVNAKYTPLKTLHQAKTERGEFTIIYQAVASKVNCSTDGRVTSVSYKKYAGLNSIDFTVEKARGRIFVVAAHVIESAKLLLASNIANSSDQVGRNLMDHPYILTWGNMPYNIGSYRGPGSTSGIPQMRDGSFRKSFAAFRVEIGNWGWMWPKLAPFSTLEEFVDTNDKKQFDGLYGVNLRNRLAEIESKRFRFGFGVEQLPNPDNRITIDARFKDALGNFKPVINYSLDKYTKQGIAEACKVSKQIFDWIPGGNDQTEYDSSHPGYFEWEGEGYRYDGPGHAAGTTKMGTSSKNSVVNSYQQSWDHENLYLIGCGSFCTIGTGNPTLTLAALAIRSAEKIIKDLR